MLLRCLHPDCTRPLSTRGNCHTHYNELSKLVKDGVTTWEQLEKDGLALPATRASTWRKQMTSDIKQHFINNPRRRKGAS